MIEPTATKERSEDARLLDAVARGDGDAIETLYRNHAQEILRFAYRRVGECYEDAQEVTQDTFITAIRMAASYDGSSTVFTWLCGIAKVRIIDHQRRLGRQKRVPVEKVVELEETSASSTSDSVLDRLEASALVEQLLSRLNGDEREALLLRYVEQLSVAEIASLMNRSEKGVEGLLTRAKNKPKAFFENWRHQWEGAR